MLSGGLLAENATVADNPQFSTQSFIQAASVKIGVEVLPLLLHKEVHITGFTLGRTEGAAAARGQRRVELLLHRQWRRRAGPTRRRRQTFPSLTVGKVDVTNGQITVATAPTGTAPATPSRIYDGVELHAKQFSFTSAFPFRVSAKLPGDGTVSVDGSAGPINERDASETPFSGHLEMKHIDPLAAGFVDASEGLSGTVDSLTLDVAWSGQQMHVTKLLVDTPHLNLVRSNAPKQPKPAGVNPEGTTMLDNLRVDSAEVKNGTLTMTTAGKAGAPAVYQQLNAQVTNLTPSSWFPFSLSASLPGGGSLSANGKAGPYNAKSDLATPVSAVVSLKHAELATSGVLAPDAGISGLADLQAQVQSNGQTLNATGTAHVDNIKLAKHGQPSAQPVNAQFTIAQNETALTGVIEHATVSVGQAVINLSGTYQSSGPTTAIDMKVVGQAIPIDAIESFLPAVGVRLPQGSRLQGGTVTTNLTVSGSTANPIISGPVRLDNTQLAGFDLGSKLQTLSRFTGGKIGSATGSGTHVRSLSMDIREQGGGIRTDNIALAVAGVGTATGAGSVSEGGALDYRMLLKLTELTGVPSNGATTAAPAAAGGGGLGGLAGGLAGLIPGGAIGGGAGKTLGTIGGITGGVLKSGIPVQIAGTTSNPTFAPNIGGLATGIGASAAQGLISGKLGGKKGSTPDANVVGDSLRKSLGGLLGK